MTTETKHEPSQRYSAFMSEIESQLKGNVEIEFGDKTESLKFVGSNYSGSKSHIVAQHTIQGIFHNKPGMVTQQFLLGAGKLNAYTVGFTSELLPESNIFRDKFLANRDQEIEWSTREKTTKKHLLDIERFERERLEKHLIELYDRLKVTPTTSEQV